MKRYRLLIWISIVFVALCLAGVFAAQQANAASSADMRTLVDHYTEEGEIYDSQAARALTMHLTAVYLFEQQGQKDKVIEHMNGFKRLLAHQLNHELIAEQAYDTLLSQAEAVILQWNSVSIIDNGEAQAVIVVEPDASERIVAAADTLAEYANKSTGAMLPILTLEDDRPAEHIPIYVGVPAPGKESHVMDQLDGLLPDGYVIHPTEHAITIMGPEEDGTEYGVYEFLECYLGVLWLMPSEAGEDVPQHTNVRIPLEDVVAEPFFMSRLLSPFHGDFGRDNPEQAEWALKNRMNGRIHFHHNLH